MNKPLPIYLQIAIRVILLRNPDYFVKDTAEGECRNATMKLLTLCHDLNPSITIENAYVFGDPFHAYAVVEGICVDLTARQFNQNNNCPKIWDKI